MDTVALAARIAQLEFEAGRQEVLHQQLVVAKGRLDRELQRFQAIQRYVQRAVLVQDLDGLHILTLEAIVEAFEFEVALFLSWDGNLSLAHAFGFDDAPAAASLPFEEGWTADGASRILKQDDPVLRAWSALGLREDKGEGRRAPRHPRWRPHVGARRALRRDQRRAALVL